MVQGDLEKPPYRLSPEHFWLKCEKGLESLYEKRVNRLGHIEWNCRKDSKD
jgi:hypothetical protein